MNPQIISLEEASVILGVSVDTMVIWNDYNILKPTITPSGKVGYRKEQIEQFATIRNQTGKVKHETGKHISYVPVIAMIISFLMTTVVMQVVLNEYFSTDISESHIALTSPVSETKFSNPVINTDGSNIGNVKTDNFSYSQIAHFTESNPEPDSVFDSAGNIKSDTSDPDLLATTILGGSLIQNNAPVRSEGIPFFAIILLLFCILAIPFIIKDQTKDSRRILELAQKADGSVVIVFREKEYKISKPELDSESDQFIERLFQVIPKGRKEIDYDCLKDEEFDLSAPLSRLVTRLGFVGLKRDLFFPRTSKTRVLFRRFVTRDDLLAMNLSEAQLSSEILTSS